MKIACISSVYGNKFHHVTPLWFARNFQYSPDFAKFYLISLDGETSKDLLPCVDYSFPNLGKDTLQLGWGDGDLPRLEKITDLCAKKYTCIHMDLDVALLKDISPIVDLPYDFIISRAFSFPKHTAKKLGFVGCTGFYIAKPRSLPLLNNWISKMEVASRLDQQIINEIFEDLIWKTKKISISNIEYKHSVSAWNNISLLILDSDVLPRGFKKISEKSFGVHNPKVMKEFWGVDQKNQAQVKN